MFSLEGLVDSDSIKWDDPFTSATPTVNALNYTNVAKVKSHKA